MKPMDIWEEKQVARPLTKSDLKKMKALPEKTLAFYRSLDRPPKLYFPPQSLPDLTGEALLLRNEDLPLKFEYSQLRSKEGLALDFSFSLTFYLSTDSTESVMDFCNTFHPQTRPCFLSDLHQYGNQEIQQTLQRFFLSYTLEELNQQDLHPPLWKALQENLSPKLQRSGLVLLELYGLHLYSKDFESLLEQKKNRILAEEHHQTVKERIQTQQELRELEIAKEYYLKRQELAKEQELSLLLDESHKEKASKRQLWLQKLKEEDEKHQSALAEARFNAELARTKKAVEELQGVPVETLIAQIENPSDRTLLLKLLLEKEMTPEQLQARNTPALAEMNAKVEQLQALLSPNLSPSTRSPKHKTHRILVASGNQVLAFNPQELSPYGKSSETYTFEERLGWIRSIVVQVLEEKQASLFAGAVHGISQQNLARSLPLQTFSFPQASKGRNGCNSMVVFKDFLYTTHSEQHLWRWHLKNYVPPEALFSSLLEKTKNVRGIQAYQNKLYFAGDSRIYRFDPNPVEEQIETAFYAPDKNSVTSFFCSENHLYCGTSDGALYRSPLEGSPQQELLARFPQSLYMLKGTLLNQRFHLLLGVKQLGVLAFCPETLQQTLYQTDQTIRWVDGQEDYLAGVDTSGHYLYVWDSQNPKKPISKCYVQPAIQDVFCWRK